MLDRSCSWGLHVRPRRSLEAFPLLALMGVNVAESDGLMQHAENIFKRFPEAFMALGSPELEGTRVELSWALRSLPPASDAVAFQERRLEAIADQPVQLRGDWSRSQSRARSRASRCRSRSRRRHGHRSRRRTRSRTTKKELDEVKRRMSSAETRLDWQITVQERQASVLGTMHEGILSLNKREEELRKEVKEIGAKVLLMKGEILEEILEGKLRG